MAGLIVIIAVAVIFAFAMILKKRPNIPDINKVSNIRDVVMSVNHGRIYPFFTGMNLKRAEEQARKIHPNANEFDNALQMQNLMGIKPYFDIPVSNKYIERISVMFNNNGIVSSIGADIKDFHINMKPLIEEMLVKFGEPTSMDDEFIIWRENWMVINIHKDGSLSVIDERLFGR